MRNVLQRFRTFNIRCLATIVRSALGFSIMHAFVYMYICMYVYMCIYMYINSLQLASKIYRKRSILMLIKANFYYNLNKLIGKIK